MEPVEVASHAVEVVPHQMRCRHKRDGLDLGYLFALAVAAVASSVAAIAVAEQLLLQPVVAVA